MKELNIHGNRIGIQMRTDIKKKTRCAPVQQIATFRKRLQRIVKGGVGGGSTLLDVSVRGGVGWGQGASLLIKDHDLGSCCYSSKMGITFNE